MRKSDLLTQIATRSHCDGYSVTNSGSRYYSQVADAFREAINELSLTVPLSDVQYLVKNIGLVVRSGQISIPSDFARLVFMETSESINFVLVDNATWQNLLRGDVDFDPPSGTTYYYVNGSYVLFHKAESVNGKEVSFNYVAGAYPNSWANDFELTQESGRFTEKFVTLVKNRAVQILNIELRGEMQ